MNGHFRDERTPLPTLRLASKRAALRLIQRACVLTGRDRDVRRQIRQAQLAARWTISDWPLEWTTLMDRGALTFERRPARHPDVTFTWPSAEEFFRCVESGAEAPSLVIEGEPQACRVAGRVREALMETLRKVMEYPYDEKGQRLA